MRQPATKTNIADLWGRKVAERRSYMGISQAQLAELCDVTQQTISKIEAGRMIPHDRLKLVLANRMAIEPGELFAWPPRSDLVERAA